MKDNQVLNSFKSYMNLPTNSQNSQDSEFSKQDSEFIEQNIKTEELIITDENELKQCLETFGEPLDLLTAKEA